MTRKKEVRDQIERFITSNSEERRELVTLGIEVETQCDNSNEDEMDGCEFWDIVYTNLDMYDYMDEDSYYSKLRENVEYEIDNNSLSSLLDGISGYLDWSPKPNYPILEKSHYDQWVPAGSNTLRNLMLSAILKEIKAIDKRAKELGIDIEANDWKIKLLNKYSEYFGEFEEAYELYDYDKSPFVESLEECERDSIDESDFYLDRREIIAAHPDLFEAPDSELNISNSELVVEEDQSVSGREIRTDKGETYDDLMTLSSEIFEAIEASNHYIDSDCSCHLHIQLGDIKHYFGDGNLQGAMMEYFAFNLDRLPASVKKRLEGGGNRWINPYLSHDKFRWVHFHPQGTIEFRLFGNIDNQEDLKVCIELALESLAYGYQVRFGDYERALKNIDIEDFLAEVA